MSDAAYKKGSTSDNLTGLIKEGYFDINRTMHDIIEKLKSRDFHYKPQDLTTPLRRIVRKGLLKKTKELPNDNKSKQWTYVKI